MLPLRDSIANCGLRRIGVQRSTADPDTWEILATVRNYGAEPRAATLALAFSGSPAGARRITLDPMTEQNVAFRYRTRAAGVLEARLRSTDAFPEDDHAALELPGQKPLGVTVYSDDPEPLRPMLAANPLVTAVFRKTAEYRPGADSGILIFDRFNPPARPANDVICIEPPADHSPVRVRTTVSDVPLTSWRSDHALAEGLRAQDLRLSSAEVFAPGPGELAVAEVEGGPVIVAHQEKPKFIVLGFHPARGALRYELTTPLLFANILRWMAPDIFRRLGGACREPGHDRRGPRHGRGGGRNTRHRSKTEPSCPTRSTAIPCASSRERRERCACIAGDREMVYSFTLPDLADAKWTPPAECPARSPARRVRAASPSPNCGPGLRWRAPWAWRSNGCCSAAHASGPGLFQPSRPQERAMSFERAWVLVVHAAAARLGRALLAQLPAPRCAGAEGTRHSGRDPGAGRPAADHLRIANGGGDTRRYLRQHLRTRTLCAPPSLAAGLESTRGRNWTAVIPFAQSARAVSSVEHGDELRLRHTAGEAGRATNLEAAVREGIASLPAGRVPRLVLISDGNENLGGVARAAWQARGLGIPIDIFPLAGRPKPDLGLESVSMPATAFTGERFPIDVAVNAPRPTRATVEIAAEGKVLGSSEVSLSPGLNQLRVHASLSTAGAMDLSGTLSAPQLGTVRFAQAVTLRRPRVLFLSLDPPGTGAHLLHTLDAAAFDVVQATSLPARLDDYQLVVFNNWNLEELPGAAKGQRRSLRQAGRRRAGHRRRAQCLRGKERRRGRAGPHAAREARSAAHSRGHLRGPDPRQVLVHGRQEDGAGATGGYRCGG